MDNVQKFPTRPTYVESICGKFYVKFFHTNGQCTKIYDETLPMKKTIMWKFYM